MEAGRSTQGRMAEFLRDHQDKVVGRWSELVAAGSRGRTSIEEVRHELAELYAIIVRVTAEADDHAAGELRASLDKFRAFATNKMNDPTRTSDGQPMDPLGMLLALLDLFIKSRNL